MRRHLARVTGSVRVRVAVVAMLVVGAVLALAAFTLARVVERRLEADQLERADVSVASVAGELEAGAALDVAIAGQFVGGDMVMVFRSPDGSVTISPQPAPFTVPLPEGAFPPITSGDASVFMAATPTDAQVVSRVVELPEGESGVLFGVTSLRDVQESVATMVRALWWGTPAVVLLVGAIAWMLVGRALRPVEQLRTTVETISRSTLEQRVGVPPSHDEVARLATTMNTMLERLQRARDHERQFVSDASHELRSPLASIRAQVEADGLAKGDPAELRAGLLAETQRLERLVDDLMELAVTDEAERPPANRIPFDIVVADEIALVQRTSPVPIVAGRIDDAEVQGRADALGRMTRNLLDNAVRHAATKVEVTLHAGERAVALTIDDDGPGVPEADRQRIFDRFGRADESRARSTGGVGLGLAVVRAVAEQHGGTVECERAQIGGARFSVVVPTAGDAASQR